MKLKSLLNPKTYFVIGSAVLAFEVAYVIYVNVFAALRIYGIPVFHPDFFDVCFIAILASLAIAAIFKIILVIAGLGKGTARSKRESLIIGLKTLATIGIAWLEFSIAFLLFVINNPTR